MQKILIVDDEEMMLKIASMILSRHYRVICTTDTEEAIKLFKQEKPDMVLSDLLMPKMDGYELYRRLQEISAEPFPIMFMTADESDETESHGFEIGAADYIRKPFKVEILLRRVSNILENLDKIHGLKKAAEIDKMTGLLNKSTAQRKISEACKTSSGVLMMIDLDSFKLVNDIHGHNMGDLILINFAEILRSEIRATDLSGRMGGDEFIAFCEHIHDEKIVAQKSKDFNEKIVEVAKKNIGEDFKIPLGVSVGAVFVPDEGTDFEILFQKADQALYKVKKNGKHGYAIYSDENKNALHEEHEISEIKKILGERNEQQGAYFVEMENFKAIYRMSVRLVNNYKKDIQFMKISLKNQSLVDEMKKLLMKTLRRSDCATQTGNSIYILLMETPEDNTKFVEERIREKIKSSEKLSEAEINFYYESV